MANSGGPERSVLSAFFHKIHCRNMSIGKDKYLAPSQKQDLPGHHTTLSSADPRLIVMA